MHFLLHIIWIKIINKSSILQNPQTAHQQITCNLSACCRMHSAHKKWQSDNYHNFHHTECISLSRNNVIFMKHQVDKMSDVENCPIGLAEDCQISDIKSLKDTKVFHKINPDTKQTMVADFTCQSENTSCQSGQFLAIINCKLDHNLCLQLNICICP